MSLRQLWIINCVSPFNCIFHRSFTTVEKRSKAIHGDQNVHFGNLDEICSVLLTEFRLNSKKDSFVAIRDSCRKQDQSPVYQLSTSNGNLWPVVAIQRNGCLFCCLPLIEEEFTKRPQLIDLPCVSLSLAVLLEIVDFLSTTTDTHIPNSPKLNQLESYICQMMPFGRPIEINAKLTEAKLQLPTQTISIPNKQPGWKINYRSGNKSNIHFAIAEFVRCAKFGNPNVDDVLQVYGTVFCKADVQGFNSRVTVTITSQSEKQRIDLENLITHPRVISMDQITGSTTSAWKLEFMPPSEKFPLCHYNLCAQMGEPISGVYKIKFTGKEKAELSLQLKLNDTTMKNSFDFCEARLPLMNRGLIKRAVLNPSWGNAVVSNKRIIIWNVGDRFPGKTFEVLLTATVFFTDFERKFADDDPFCVDQNAYSQIAFKSSCLLSGCFIDTKTLQTFPATKTKVLLDRELIATDYKIWNSLGDAPFTTAH